MNSHVRPDFRHAIVWAVVYNTPALLIAALAAYAAQRFHPMLFVGTAIMGFVYCMNLFTQLRQIKWAAAMVARTQPVAMLLTADKGWHEVQLHPAQQGSGLPTIHNVRFITKFSGVSVTAQQGTPVQVYLDQADPDLIVLRVGDRFLSSDITHRYSEGGEGPQREYETHDAGTPPTATPPTANRDSMPALQEGIQKLAAEYQLQLVASCGIGLLLIGISCAVTGAWQLVWQWRAVIASPLGHLEQLIFPLFFIAASGIFITRLSGIYRMMLRGRALVKHTAPTPHSLHVYPQRSEDGKSTAWIVDIGAPDDRGNRQPLYSILLLVTMKDTRAESLCGTIGQVYATSQPGDPVVIQTVDGVLVGKRQATPAAGTPTVQ